MKQRRLFSCPGALEGGEGYLTVLFCIPDTIDWRATAYACLSNLAYGRAYDGKTGNIRATLEVAEGIVESIMMCDIESKLERIAVALEHLEAIETSQTVSLEDIVSQMEETTVGDVADLLEIFGFIGDIFPLFSIRLGVTDLLTTIGTMRYRSSMTNLLFDIAVSQRGQAVAQGGVDFAGAYDTVEDLVDVALLPSGIAGKLVWFWRQVAPAQVGSWLAWITSITGLLLGSIRGAAYDIGDKISTLGESFGVEVVVNSPNTINVPEDAINVEISCAKCGQSQGLCGCPDIDGPVAGVETVGIDPCDTTIEDYDDYLCRASNFVADTLSDMSLATANMLSSMLSYINSTLASGDVSLQEIYTKVQQYAAAGLPQFVWFNLPVSARQDFGQLMTDRVVEIIDAAGAAGVPESESLINVVLGWTQAFSDAALYMQQPATKGTFVQSLFDDIATQGGDSASWSALVISHLIDAVDASLGNGIQGAKDILSSLVTEGLTGIFSTEVPQVRAYGGSVDCGSIGCCYDFVLVTGTQDGDTLSSAYVDGYHTIEVHLNVDDLDSPCEQDRAFTPTNVTGFTSIGISSVQVDGVDVCDTPDGCGEQCGHKFKFRSLSTWSFDFPGSVGCV